MTYLIRDISPEEERRRERKRIPLPVAHLWDGTDTRCRMWSTGGIQKKNRYFARATPEGRKVCNLCLGEPALDQGFWEALLRDPDPSPPSAPAGNTSAVRETLLRKLGPVNALFDASGLQVLDEKDIGALCLVLCEPF